VVAPEREAIRLKLLKIGAQVRRSVRRIKIANGGRVSRIVQKAAARWR
jgi:hypothetical protein